MTKYLQDILLITLCFLAVMIFLSSKVGTLI